MYPVGDKLTGSGRDREFIAAVQIKGYRSRATSHLFAPRVIRQFGERKRFIVCHLRQGASICWFCCYTCARASFLQEIYFALYIRHVIYHSKPLSWPRMYRCFSPTSYLEHDTYAIWSTKRENCH